MRHFRFSVTPSLSGSLSQREPIKVHSVLRHARILKCLCPATKKVVIDKGNKQLVMMSDGKRQHGSRLFLRVFFFKFSENRVGAVNSHADNSYVRN